MEEQEYFNTAHNHDGINSQKINDNFVLTSTEIINVLGYTPVANTSSAIEAALGFTPENVANKSTDGTMAYDSDTLYPSQKAVVTYVASNTPFKVAQASNNLQINNAAAQTSSISFYTIVKQTTVYYGGTMRVIFDLKTDNATYTGYGKIYINGVAIGPERSTNSTAYVTQASTDITVKPSDLIQIYVYAHLGSANIYVRNFNIYYDVVTGNPYTINF